MKRPLRLFLILVGIYLAVTAIVGAYAEVKYRKELASILMLLGGPAFRATGQLQKDMAGDASLHRFNSFLRLTPPIGWIVLHRMANVEAAVLYASKNYALPTAQRFSNPDEAKSYGFDPAKKSELEIGDATVKGVW